MKVVIITKYFYPVKGGIENHCYNLAKHLSNMKVDVEIHASTQTLTGKNILKNSEIIDGVKVFRHKNFSFYFLKNKYNVVHLHNFNIFPHFWIFFYTLILTFLQQKKYKLVITPHGGVVYWGGEFGFLKKIIKKIYHKTIGKFLLNVVVDKIICVSEYEKEQLINFGINKKKLVCIPNGIEDLAYTLPPQKSSDSIAKYKPYILFLGRISKGKNIDFVIRCLGKIEGINLIIAGPIHEKDYYQYLDKFIKKMALEKRVIFYGEVFGNNKYRLIDNSLAVVLASHMETDPIVIKEGMSRGKPVIVSDKASLPYIAKDFENGFVVSNEKEFVDVINLLLSDQDLVERIAKNGKIKSKEWKWDNIAKKILKVYKGVENESCNNRV